MIEYAMTQWNDGRTRCQRPEHVTEAAARLMRWAGGGTDACQTCGRPSTRLLRSMPLCEVCATECRTWMTGTPLDRPESRAVRPGALRGLAIVFDQPSEDMGFREVIKAAAVNRNATEQVDVRALWSHDQAEPIGRLSAGTLRTRVTDAGVAVEIDPPTSAASRVESIQRRDVVGMSFAFEALTDDWRMQDGTPHRDVLDMRYVEVSPVAFPAYPQTSIEVVSKRDTKREDTDYRLRLVR